MMIKRIEMQKKRTAKTNQLINSKPIHSTIVNMYYRKFTGVKCGLLMKLHVSI